MAIGTIAVVALAACSGSGNATTAPAASTGGGGGGGAAPCAKATAAGTVAAAMKGFAFDPATITVKVGDTITWTNNDSAAHTATVDSQPDCDTGSVAGGATGSITFSAAGTYAFHCKIHPSMKGTITVG
jgi:plastocyanin